MHVALKTDTTNGRKIGVNSTGSKASFLDVLIVMLTGGLPLWVGVKVDGIWENSVQDSILELCKWFYSRFTVTARPESNVRSTTF